MSDDMSGRTLECWDKGTVAKLRAEIERLRALLRPFVDMVAEPEDFAAARRALGKW